MLFASTLRSPLKHRLPRCALQLPPKPVGAKALLNADVSPAIVESGRTDDCRRLSRCIADLLLSDPPSTASRTLMQIIERL